MVTPTRPAPRQPSALVHLLLALPLGASGAASNANGTRGQRDLAFVHIPYNFGHTVEKNAAFGPGSPRAKIWLLAHSPVKLPYETLLKRLRKPSGEIWGSLHPLLRQTEPTTGCPLYFAPQKFWPEGVARSYIGDKKVFGILRNPMEKLVAEFRGSAELSSGGGDVTDYATMNPKYLKSCDVDGAIYELMTELVNGTRSRYGSQCGFTPQAEYFEGPHGINVPVDNLRFPTSVNKILEEHGYSDLKVTQRDIMHVHGCTEIWSKDLKPRTRELIKKFYARDYELICKHFGRCDEKDGDTCLALVTKMCPKHAGFFPY